MLEKNPEIHSWPTVVILHDGTPENGEKEIKGVPIFGKHHFDPFSVAQCWSPGRNLKPEAPKMILRQNTMGLTDFLLVTPPYLQLPGLVNKQFAIENGHGNSGSTH